MCDPFIVTLNNGTGYICNGISCDNSKYISSERFLFKKKGTTKRQILQNKYFVDAGCVSNLIIHCEIHIPLSAVIPV